jgi:hypothetical protein
MVVELCVVVGESDIARSFSSSMVDVIVIVEYAVVVVVTVTDAIVSVMLAYSDK